jgi:5-methylcytosine-specific restriction endonuclease McrA
MASTRGVKSRAGGRLTEAQRWTKIRTALRKAWLYYPSRQVIKERERVIVVGEKHRFEYPCANCGGLFKDREVDVDHIIPAGSLQTDANSYLERLFCEPEELQILCKPCHKAKTKRERESK